MDAWRWRSMSDCSTMEKTLKTQVQRMRMWSLFTSWRLIVGENFRLQLHLHQSMLFFRQFYPYSTLLALVLKVNLFSEKTFERFCTLFLLISKRFIFKGNVLKFIDDNKKLSLEGGLLLLKIGQGFQKNRLKSNIQKHRKNCPGKI